MSDTPDINLSAHIDQRLKSTAAQEALKVLEATPTPAPTMRPAIFDPSNYPEDAPTLPADGHLIFEGHPYPEATPAPTPETDKEEGKAIDYVNFDGDETLLVPSKFARNLERQRDEAVAVSEVQSMTIDSLKKQLEQASADFYRMQQERNEAVAKLEEAKRLAAEGRLAGRQEAVAILIRLGPEELNEFAENAPLADSGDYDCYFNEEKLRDALDAHTGTMSSKLDELEGAYWEVLSKCDEIQQERDALKAEVEALSKRSRVMGCGYCGCEVFEFPTDNPAPEECERALTLFAQHDRTCPKNPLAVELDRLNSERENWRLSSVCRELRAEVERLRTHAEAMANDVQRAYVNAESLKAYRADFAKEGK